MKRLVVVALAVVAVLGWREGVFLPRTAAPGAIEATHAHDALRAAYENHSSGLEVRGAGEVIRVLPDDDAGIRHQRFILRTASGQTLLVAHNIDLAPRIGGLRVGDRVEFRGEYEWNAKGGVIHWTHRDPRGRHRGGWLEYEGRRYE